MCRELGPGNRSKNPYLLKEAFSGRQIHMIWFFKCPGIISSPVHVAFHLDSAISRLKLWIYINLCYLAKNLKPTDSVFRSVVLKRQRHFYWSEKFFPILGLLINVLISIASSSVPFLMLEFNRIYGELLFLLVLPSTFLSFPECPLDIASTAGSTVAIFTIFV